MNIIESIKQEFIKAISHLAKADSSTGNTGTEVVSGDTKTAPAKIYSPSEISLSDKVIGSKVELINADGSLSDAPNGEYELEDGFKFTVTDSLISAIAGQEEAPVEEMAVDAPAEPNPEIEAIKAELETLKGSVADILTAIATLTDSSASKQDVKQFESEVTKLNETIVKLAKLPAEQSKTNQNNLVRDKATENLNELAKILFNNKK